MNTYYVIAIWAGMALLASLVSIRLAIPAALAEIVVGALARKVTTPVWVTCCWIPGMFPGQRAHHDLRQRRRYRQPNTDQ